MIMKRVIIGGLIFAFIEILLFILIGAITGSSLLTLGIGFVGCITAVLALVLMFGYMIWKVIYSKK